jgi:hypothetical protein
MLKRYGRTRKIVLIRVNFEDVNRSHAFALSVYVYSYMRLHKRERCNIKMRFTILLRC